MAGGLFAAEFFRITIALVVALGVAVVVVALAYHVHRLQRKIDVLEGVIEDVGSTEYLRWALEQTDEFLDVGTTQDGSAPQRRRHLWVVPAVALGWLGTRLARQPLATATAAALTAVVASIATAPVPSDPGTWNPPAGAETVPTTAPLELTQPHTYGTTVPPTSSTTATTTTSTTLKETEDLAVSTTTTTTVPLPATSTTLPPTTTTTVPPKGNGHGGPPLDGPPVDLPQIEDALVLDLGLVRLSACPAVADVAQP